MDSDLVQKSLDAATKSLASKDESPLKPEFETSSSEDNSEPKEKEAKKEDNSKENNKEIKETELEKVDFKVVYNKKKYDVSFQLDGTLAELKVHLQPLIGLTPTMMKVVVKGVSKDEETLRKLGVGKGSKIMVLGSSLQDVLALSTKPSEKQLREMQSDSGGSNSAESSLTGAGSSKAKQHAKVLEKGKPDDIMPGRKGVKEGLPPAPLSGMLNKSGGKVRLTFKMELDQLWLGTKERTEKLPMSSIKGVVSEAIEGHEGYHIMALQLGPTEASRYWIYWVPSQYVDAIKDSVLGKWQFY